MKRKLNELPDFQHTPPPPEPMVTKKSWNEFRSTGLFMFINTILHAFGWAIVVDVNDKGGVIDAYPARVKFRGFDEEDQTIMHKKIGAYLKENADQLHNEANDKA
jgi:hypothetical protein